jgi:hypothetical protein
MEENNMILTISSDLNINRFSHENDIAFAERVIYSALSCWIKTTTQDIDINSDGNGVSRAHVYDRCNSVLDGFLQRYKYLHNYFIDLTNDKFNSVIEIRHRLFQSGDLVNVGFKTSLGLSNSKIVPITNDVCQIVGCLNDSNVSYSGIATICKNELEFDMPSFDSLEWLKNYVDKACWKKGSITLSNLEFFNAHKSSYNNYGCWENYRNDNTCNFKLLRIKNDYGYEYMLEKNENGQSFYHTLDYEIFLKTKEFRRFQFALRKLANNEPKAYIDVYDDSVSLELKTLLPNRERIALETFAWPSVSVSENRNWIMGIEVWKYVKSLLMKLGIQIEEN